MNFGSQISFRLFLVLMLLQNLQILALALCRKRWNRVQNWIFIWYTTKNRFSATGCFKIQIIVTRTSLERILKQYRIHLGLAEVWINSHKCICRSEQIWTRFKRPPSDVIPGMGSEGIFRNFAQLPRSVSPSSRGVRSSDYVHSRALNVILKKNKKVRKNIFSEKRCDLISSIAKPIIHLHRPKS